MEKEKAHVFYNKNRDEIKVLWNTIEAPIAEWKGRYSLYRSFITKKIIGAKVEGIKDILKNKEDRSDKGVVFYNKDGDEIEVLWSNDDYYGEGRGKITLYKREKDDKIIGFVIHRIKEIIEKEEKL